MRDKTKKKKARKYPLDTLIYLDGFDKFVLNFVKQYFFLPLLLLLFFFFWLILKNTLFSQKN